MPLDDRDLALLWDMREAACEILEFIKRPDACLKILSTPTRKRGYPLCSVHSYLRDTTGFASAARTACVLTVTSAITNARLPANANTHHSIPMR